MKTIFIILGLFFIFSSSIKDRELDGISIGMTVEDFLKVTNEKYSVKKETISLEGLESSIYNVYENEEIIYAVELGMEERLVWRIWLYSVKFKTEKGIGIGNTLGELRENYTIKSYSVGEGKIAVFVEEIAVSFLLDSRQIPREWWSEMKYANLNDNVVIDLIIFT